MSMDECDPLREFRSRFRIPLHGEGKSAREAVYMCGNSLGLLPLATEHVVAGEIKKWGDVGVKGHFEGDIPWARCEELLPALAKDMIGAEDAQLEIGFSNSLTVNLHMLMAAFYRPSGERNAILIEAAAFPSDRYATSSHIINRGLDPETCLIEVTADDSINREESCERYGLLTTERIMEAITANKDRLALVLLSGLQYLTGQVFDIEKITAHVHKINAVSLYHLY